jgi:hypothetical protein
VLPEALPEPLELPVEAPEPLELPVPLPAELPEPLDAPEVPPLEDPLEAPELLLPEPEPLGLPLELELLPHAVVDVAPIAIAIADTETVTIAPMATVRIGLSPRKRRTPTRITAKVHLPAHLAWPVGLTSWNPRAACAGHMPVQAQSRKNFLHLSGVYRAHLGRDLSHCQQKCRADVSTRCAERGERPKDAP